MKIKLRPFNLLLIIGIVIAVLSLFKLNSRSTFDIHVHDTYYVIHTTLILLALSIFAVLMWLLYIVTNRILYSKVLTWAHVLFSVSTLSVLVWAVFFGYNIFDPSSRRYIDNHNWTSFNSFQTYSKAITMISFIVVVGQLFYLINLIAGFFSRAKR